MVYLLSLARAEAGQLLGIINCNHARQRLIAAQAEAREQTEADNTTSGFRCYQRGLFAQALGEHEEAATWLERTLVLPER